MERFNVEEILEQLTLDEKVSLTRGSDMWHTTPVPRLHIPSLRLSDGPNGVRGTKFFEGTPSACLPCGTAMGATWDVKLTRQLANLLGLEAKSKGAHIVLAPTVNIQRTPLGGRGFESFAEDPVLSGLLAAAYCNGVQEEGIIPTIKHFVCNDQEDKRMSANIVLTERALREIYLLPFMLAVRDSNPRGFMTSYNKVNGVHCSEDTMLLIDVLRGEWNWKGLIVSDWYGTYSVSEALKAGLDLEMPGPSRWRTLTLSHALNAGKLEEKLLDERVRNVLNAVKEAQRSGIIEHARETVRNSKADRLLLRRAAADSIVLLKNDDDILPLKFNRTTAVIGSNARVATYCGGGSASLRPYYSTPVLDSMKAKCADVRFAEGPFSHLEFSLLDHVLTDSNGNPGFTFRAYLDPPDITNRECIDTMFVKTTKFFLTDYSPPKLKSNLFWAEMEATLTPDRSGPWDFGLCAYGTARMFIDGVEIIDNETYQEPGNAFLGAGTKEVMGSINLQAERSYRLLIKFGSAPTCKLHTKGIVTFRKGGVRMRGGPRIDVQKAISEAMHVAKNAEQVVVVTGLNGDWEIEGQDRTDINLPPHTDELIYSILSVRPDAVIVTQSGMPVAMPWASKAKAMIHMWYGGNEGGNGLSDVIFGDTNPGGKLPLTFPKRLEDCPGHLFRKADSGRIWYGEDIYVGYRYYDTVSLPVQFPFGHGLSYTTFSMTNLNVTHNVEDLRITLDLQNAGLVRGSEVVQVYVSHPSSSISRPKKELKGFCKCYLDVQEIQSVEVKIPIRYATSFWDESQKSWNSEKGTYVVWVGNSSLLDEKCLRATFKVQETVLWNGI